MNAQEGRILERNEAIPRRIGLPAFRSWPTTLLWSAGTARDESANRSKTNQHPHTEFAQALAFLFRFFVGYCHVISLSGLITLNTCIATAQALRALALCDELPTTTSR
jgi:hypothetical protein